MSILPSKDRRYLSVRGIAYREVEQGGQKGVILTDFPLPDGKFQVSQANILIVLPPGYPDAPPDMFYAVPHLLLVAGRRAPRATQVQLNFDGQNWQRWSRHNNQWRPGADGLWTMIKRIEVALEVAA